jgi:Fe-S oxidoreductase
MSQEVTRPILWNVPIGFQVLLYILLLLLAAFYVYTALRWYRLVALGTGEDRFDQPLKRLWLAVRDALGQRAVVRESWGWMHYTLYVGFVGLFIGTTIVFINSDVRAFLRLFGINLYFYYGAFYLVYKAAMDTFFLLLIVGTLASAARRLLVRPGVLAQPAPEKLNDNLENQLGYWFAALILALVAITGLMLEGARINAERPSFTEWAYLGRALARLEAAAGAGISFHRYLWLIHMLLVYLLLFSFAFSKLRHIFIAPINLFFRTLKPRGRLAPITDFENAETFGVSRVEQYTWKQLLDMASCLECGRCTINCPTVVTGKALNPKHLVIAQREHLLRRAPALLHSRGAADQQNNGNGEDMVTQVATEPVIWGCTTCGWCEEGCPVGIEHIQRIVDMRRYLVLMESKFPQEATAAFKGIEVQGNPWGLDQSKRAEWAAGLDIPIMSALGDSHDVEVLYWVGCAGSYDERNQKVSRAFASLLRQAGVRFAILGAEEACTGDPARRLGNEYLYATVAANNVETLNRYKPRRIVTQCPHCYHNLKKEYPDYGGNFEVIHEGEFLDELVRTGRLTLSREIRQRVTYHDPCYMARHSSKWEGARGALGAVPGVTLTDVEQCKHRTFCCGAGGGGFWKEEERESMRINQKRFAQLTQANPRTLAVGCPFCMIMMEDAVKSRMLEDQVAVRDLAEIIAESAGAPTK